MDHGLSVDYYFPSWDAKTVEHDEAFSRRLCYAKTNSNDMMNDAISKPILRCKGKRNVFFNGKKISALRARFLSLAKMSAGSGCKRHI